MTDNRSPFPEDPRANAETFPAGHGPQSGTVGSSAPGAGSDLQAGAGQARRQTGAAIDGAADWLREQSDSLPGGETPRRYVRRAADGMSQGANYLRDHDTKAIAGDLEEVVRRHPIQSLAAVAVVGFLLGRALRHG